ncbi:lipopolysaccharide biosynthesis protein [Flavobacterium sp.]|jgi:teichuronic acid exporter|uniref:lipopolysaccharide biosynthesis protein n=1 Tax=Flavobacterium sp. TaxID=239 RepID=UPI0037848370
MSLKKQTVDGVIWSAIERFVSLGVQFIIMIIIARVLSPSDYGLIGMLFVFIALGGVILDAGFGQALIRKTDVTQIEFTSVFYFNIMMSILIYLLLFMAAPYIAKFYNTPELERIAKFVFLIFPIKALGIIQNTIIVKAVAFKLMTKISLSAALLSGIIGILMAYDGYGVWALVYQSLLFALFNTLFLWIFNGWRPLLKFDMNPIKQMFSFSFNLLTTNVIIVLFNNIYTLLIGQYYPLVEVGFYNQAKRLQEIPSQSLTAIVQRVSYPVLSKLNGQNENLKRGYKKIINQTIFLNFPMMLGFLAVSNNLIYVLLSEKWLPCVPYFQLLCLYGAIFPLHSININILKVIGKSKKILQLEIISRIIIVVAILLTLKRGIIPLLTGQVITAVIFILINMYFCGKEINFKVKEQVLDVVPYFLVATFSAGIMATIGFFLSENPALVLCLQVIIGMIFYFLLSHLFKLSAYIEYKNILLNLIKRKH